MFQEANIEQIFNVVKGNVKLFKLFKCLNSLDFFEFTSGQVQHSHISKACANIAETLDDRVVQFELLEATKDLTCHLQVVALGVYS